MNRILKLVFYVALLVLGILLIIWVSKQIYGLFTGDKETLVQARAMKSSFPMNNQVNVYGEKLMACEPTQPTEGSQVNGTCSELGGGVHQICFGVNDETKSFSEDTGQSSWSEGRKGKNHCMCLGAWALYKARQDAGEIAPTSGELKCESIPSVAFSEEYVGKWNSWNGDELPGQIKNGVVALYNQCKAQANGDTKKLAVLNSYYKKLRNSGLYKKATNV
tara:strand:- start:135 stop:794 length:660 start_codon:yes stop_codon:yes gene_type:complete